MADQPTPSYVDTILIDCNRLNSEEVKAGNTTEKALFTNKVGSGLKLNAGDKISVHSGFVSDRGCGGEVIEFNGRDLNVAVQTTYLKQNLRQTLTSSEDATPFGNYPPDNCHLNYYTSETTTSAPLKDNSATIGVSFWKSSNGEGYFHLPRRYDALKPTFYYSDPKIGTHGHTNSTLSDWVVLLEGRQYAAANQYQSPFVDTGTFWVTLGLPAQWLDSYANGRSIDLSQNMEANPFDAAANDIPPEVTFWRGRVCHADTYRYNHGTYSPETPNANSPYEREDWDWITLAGVGDGTYHQKIEFVNNLWKKKNDGSRYTIFKKETNYRTFLNQHQVLFPDVTKLNNSNDSDTEEDNLTVSRADYNQAHTDNGGYEQHPRDPSLSEYMLYVEPQTLTAPTGYSAPQNVADELTNQLNRTEDPEDIVDGVGGLLPRYPTTADAGIIDYPTNGDTTFATRQREGAYMNGETYKAMNSATSVSFQFDNWIQFIKDDVELSDTATRFPASTVPPLAYFNKQLTDYLSSFETIGVKRPELWIKGREFAKEVGGIWEVDTTDADGVATLKKVNMVGASDDITKTGTDTNFPWRNIIFPCISEDLLPINIHTQDIKTNIPWTEGNLNKLKEWFDAQGKYPELFEHVERNSNRVQVANPPYNKLSPDHMRFLHMNPYHTAYGYKYSGAVTGYEVNDGEYSYKNILGDDGLDAQWTQTNQGGYGLDASMYRGINSPTMANLSGDTDLPGPNDYGTDFSSFPIWFYYDKSRSDVASGGLNENELYYGFAKKHVVEFSGDYNNPALSTADSGTKYYGISFTTTRLDGICEYLYVPKIDYTDAERYIEQGRPIGYDPHFNAYGTAAICMYAGFLDKEPKPSDSAGGKGSPYQVACYNEIAGQDFWWVFQNWMRYYVGANNPQISFDEKASRFSLQSLHTPEQIGNLPEGGSSDVYPVIDDASDEVYKINKELLGNVFCPDMIPYAFGSGVVTGAGATKGKLRTTIHNQNILPYTIMDAHGGIFIEDFGVPESAWDESIWGILGFSYAQFHSAETLTRQTRINNVVTTDNIGKVTTNANIVPSTLNEWVTNELGVPLYTQQVPKLWRSVLTGAGNVGEFTQRADYQPINIDQTSAQINAERLPRKMLRPYFLIRSNIIGDVNYLGGADGGQGLPIVYVINKENAFGDYFFQAASQNEFTVTNSRTLTEITTSIHNPDMSLASLSNDSAIIYKIEKTNNAQLNVAEQVLNKSKKK